MIVAFSTSSPLASTALIGEDGSEWAHDAREAPFAAGGACLEMLEEMLASTGHSLEEATLFAADLGPGSFTGVKVGVTLAKTFGLACGVKVAGLTSFDLIGPDDPVAVPSRKGEYLVRVPGSPPARVSGAPGGGVLGYGPDFVEPRFPQARAFARAVASLERMAPEALLPAYVLGPSISTPKRPYGVGGG